MPDDRRDLAVSDELLGDPGRGSTIAIVVPVDHLEGVAVDASCLVDLFGRELDPLEVLESIALLPGPGGSDDVRILVSCARGERQQCECQYSLGQQLPLSPIWGFKSLE
jgi:hypothetical protein